MCLQSYCEELLVRPCVTHIWESSTWVHWQDGANFASVACWQTHTYTHTLSRVTLSTSNVVWHHAETDLHTRALQSTMCVTNRSVGLHVIRNLHSHMTTYSLTSVYVMGRGLGVRSQVWREIDFMILKCKWAIWERGLGSNWSQGAMGEVRQSVCMCVNVKCEVKWSVWESLDREYEHFCPSFSFLSLLYTLSHCVRWSTMTSDTCRPFHTENSLDLNSAPCVYYL